MRNPATSAFTLIELLVVVAIIGIIAAIALPVYASVQKKGKATEELSNMRQLGIGFMSYTNDNDTVLPYQGSWPKDNDTWTNLSTPSNYDLAWYNVIPRYCNADIVYKDAPASLGTALQREGAMGLRSAAYYGQSATTKTEFYKSGKNVLCSRLAVFQGTPATASSPIFSIAMNSKLITSTGVDAQGNVTMRLNEIQLPSKTVLFLSAGVPGETKTYSAQSTYNGQAAVFASRFIARNPGKKGLLVFCDGHSESLTPDKVVNSSTGKSIQPSTPDTRSVIWTADPTLNADN